MAAHEAQAQRYLCQACEEFWSRFQLALNAHDRDCMFKRKEPYEKTEAHRRNPYRRGYCTCEYGTTYKGSRLRGTVGDGTTLTCPLCIFIWYAADLISRRASSTVDDNSPAGTLGDSVDFTVALKVPYQRSTIKVDGLGQCQFRLYEKIDTPLPSSMQPNSPDNNTRSTHWRWLSSHPEAKSLFMKVGPYVASQIALCQKHHPECQAKPIDVFPSRLLQLESNHDDFSARLVDVTTMTQRPLYATLSYCWGTKQPLITQKHNLSRHLVSIEVNKLSPSIVDAIKLTISAGIRYLWVDALCIVQDSDEDKGVEIAKMANIYQGAVCTFSAASAKSSLDGFHSQGVRRDRMIFETAFGLKSLIEICPVTEDDLLSEPIHQRGWTLQETLLSPRLVTILSEDRRAQFRCKTMVRTADGAQIGRMPRLLEYGSSTSSHEYFSEQRFQIPWFDIIMEYSKRAFSDRSDKFPAIAAIAQSYEESNELGSYVAGIFTHALSWELLWSCQDTNGRGLPADEDQGLRQSEQAWIAPSWSWASRSHPVHYTAIDKSDRSMFKASDCIKDLHFNVDPISPHVANGKIKSAVLTMRCYSWKMVWGESRIQGKIFIDDHPCPLQKGEELWCVHVANQIVYDDMTFSNGLIIKKTHDSGVEPGAAIGVFKRVGMYLFGPRSYFVGRKEIVPTSVDGFPKEVKLVTTHTFKLI